MKRQSLNGRWKIRWTDGQRGGAPHFAKEPGQAMDADLLDIKKEISDMYDPVKWIDATVPGEIHLDLLEAGLIEDPYTGINILKCRWVEEYYWYYRKVFDAKEAAKTKYAFLHFKGLDYAAKIYLNGKEIARHANSFRPLSVDVSGLLKKSGNVLVVGLDSGLYSVSEKPIRHLYSATMGIDNLLHKRVWLRKPQSSTEWDWSQRLLNVGIFDDVDLLWSDHTVVIQSQVRNDLSPDLKKAKSQIRFFPPKELSFSQRALGKDVKVSLKLNGKDHTVDKLTLEEGCISADFTVDKPRLWYPIGYGEQNLYEIEYTLHLGGIQVYTERKKTGYRYVLVDQSPHEKEGGNYFVIYVNNIPVFAKGANLVPADMITAAISDERYETLVDRAIEANFNILRVWGGGLYESDYFYSLCDEKGLLVWQEFISACATLPYDDPEFKDEVHKEATYQMRRLSIYPSLIVWCGNNEVDVHGVKEFTGSKDLPQDTPLYFEALPKILKEEDPEKYYQPSSPYSFDGSPSWNDLVGDQHPWQVGFENKDHRLYRDMKCRFPNEGGILGTTSLSTVESSLLEGQAYMHSFSWDIHDNMLENWKPGTSADNNVKFWLNIDVRSLDLDKALYALGAVQAEGLSTYIDHFRSRKFDSSAAIFWMYNDCWPATITWTVVDHALNRTPSFYAVKRAFAPIRALISKNSTEEKYEILVNNDRLDSFKLNLESGFFTCDGRISDKMTQDIEISANACESFRLLGKDPKNDELIPYIILRDTDGNIISQNRYLEKRFYEIPLIKSPDIKVEKEEDWISFTSNVFVLNASTDLEGKREDIDSMFDLIPGIPYRIKTKNPDFNIIYSINDLIGR